MSPVYKCILVREGEVGSEKANTPDTAASIANALVKDSPQEMFLAIMVDTKLRVIGSTVISIGLLDATVCHPREVFRAAIISNAKAVILAHNHPSGDLTPSSQDKVAYRNLKDAGAILGIEVLDSIIVDGQGGSYSIREHK